MHTSDVTLSTVQMPTGFHITGNVTGRPASCSRDRCHSGADRLRCGVVLLRVCDKRTPPAIYSITVPSGTYVIEFYEIASATTLDGYYTAGPPNNYGLDWGLATPVNATVSDASVPTVQMSKGSTSGHRARDRRRPCLGRPRRGGVGRRSPAAPTLMRIGNYDIFVVPGQLRPAPSKTIAPATSLATTRSPAPVTSRRTRLSHTRGRGCR